jgi:hypothetical protein
MIQSDVNLSPKPEQTAPQVRSGQRPAFGSSSRTFVLHSILQLYCHNLSAPRKSGHSTAQSLWNAAYCRLFVDYITVSSAALYGRPGTAIIELIFFFRSLSQTPVAPAQMLKAFKLFGTTGGLRNFSQQIAVTTRARVPNSKPQLPSPNLVRYAYYVPRNSRGALPVYSDIRNNGTRILVLIRNVEGNVEVRLLTDHPPTVCALITAIIYRNSPRISHKRCVTKAPPMWLACE